MASSIHTIYRPLARSRRVEASVHAGMHKQLPSVPDTEDDQPPEEPVVSEEELEEDFEPPNPDVPEARNDNRRSLRMSLPPVPEFNHLEAAAVKTHPARSGSMATVKLQRRARLAEKLREIFEVSGIQEVNSGVFQGCNRSRVLLIIRCRDAMLAPQIRLSVLQYFILTIRLTGHPQYYRDTCISRTRIFASSHICRHGR